MVWGMTMPVGFGEFWPDGEFEYDRKAKESGWRDRLRLHYLAQSPEEQIRLYDYRSLGNGHDSPGYGAAHYQSITGKFRCEIGTKDGPDHLPFTPAEAHEAPQTFDTAKTYASLGAMIKLNDRLLAADDDFRAIVERMEPSVHQFFPLEIKMPKGKTYPKNYYTLVIGQYFDSYVPEMSDEGEKHFTGRAYSKAAFGAAHLWRDRRSPLLNWLSDELKAEIDKAGLRLPKHYKMREV